MSKRGVSRSTIFPLPSSPHCAPSTARFIVGLRFYPQMISLTGSALTLDQLLAVADAGEHVTIAPEAAERVRAARRVVDAHAGGDDPVYGINTGFGSFAEIRIPADALERLQHNLVRSHAAGVGEPLPRRAVRAAVALRANVLAKGFSGIRLETLERLV